MPKPAPLTGFGVMGMNEYLEENKMSELREYVASLTDQGRALLREIAKEYETPPKCPRCGNDILITSREWGKSIDKYGEGIAVNSAVECARCQIRVTGRNPGDAENKWREMYNGCQN